MCHVAITLMASCMQAAQRAVHLAVSQIHSDAAEVEKVSRAAARLVHLAS